MKFNSVRDVPTRNHSQTRRQKEEKKILFDKRSNTYLETQKLELKEIHQQEQ